MLTAVHLPVTKTLFEPRLLPNRSLPPYSYVPGLFPHPESDPHGHSFQKQHPRSIAPTTGTWPACDEYLWGIDLFNCGYYWEAHESWEQAWHACGRKGNVADFLKGLIKLAAAGVKAREGVVQGIERHARRARDLFERVSGLADESGTYMGVPLQELMAAAELLSERPQAVINTSEEAVIQLMPFQLHVARQSRVQT